ncbi:MAG: hypothetical protein AB7U79_01470 [Candidatus Izemoplasmatales bacterium]
MLIIDWKAILELTFLILFVVGVIAIASIFLIRSILASYKEVFKYQSKFDIELRKTLNLISKVVNHEKLNEYSKMTIKDLSFEDKKKLMLLIDQQILYVDRSSEENTYIFETYDNLHEVRRTRDSLALIYNQKIMMFPFNIYSRILKKQKWEIYTDNL